MYLVQVLGLPSRLAGTRRATIIPKTHVMFPNVGDTVPCARTLQFCSISGITAGTSVVSSRFIFMMSQLKSLRGEQTTTHGDDQLQRKSQV